MLSYPGKPDEVSHMRETPPPRSTSWSSARFSEEAFTLVELLVVVAIVGILGTTAVNMSAQIRAKAADAQAQSAQANMMLALSDTFSKVTEAMPNKQCNGADAAYYKRSGSTTTGLQADGAYTTALASTGAQPPETYFQPNKSVGYVAMISTSVLDSGQLAVYTWNCKGSAMYLTMVNVTCGSTGAPGGTDLQLTLPLPANCETYPY